MSPEQPEVFMFEPIPIPTDPAFLWSGSGVAYVRGFDRNIRERATQQVPFGMLDSRGREVGARITVYRVDRVPVVGTHSLLRPDQLGTGWFVLDIHATRDGQDYGACQPTSYFKTAEARDEAVERYLTSAKKRAATAAAKAAR